ncbi:BRCA1-A complex subunit BRE-like [Asbolus verrucosus]|uniref:BRISC and BRCA1-A complex member 2 n=1 Tax=Asbolus verrucosus TaxID=1661398 RepID=A0A482VJQ7_ASBVE|nr:BRCA1-A complex subunit BRE-like [Asbolus verrucosus]
MDLLPYNNENLLINFPPLLRRNFEELFCHGKIGLTPFTLSDISFTKQYTENNSTYSYYYTLKIPYAGKRLSWELIFNPEDMCFAPDFSFNDDTFYMSHDLDVIVENVPSLMNWNVNDSKSLTNVLKEFLNLFKKQQIEKLHKENIYSQLCTEYQHLTEEVITPSDIEVYLENTSVHFVINIKVDLSSLPEYSQTIFSRRKDQSDILLNPGEDNCILKMSYIKLDGSRVNASLQLSPRVEQALGNAKTFHIPNYSKQTSLFEYVTLIGKLLRDQVKKVAQHYKLKKEYINCLCTMYAQNMIEFDSETFHKGVFLCEVGDYHCLVHVDISDLFPQEKPTVTLHSLYCASPKKPCLEVVEDYPYSPRWEPNMMLQKLKVYLVEATKIKDLANKCKHPNSRKTHALIKQIQKEKSRDKKKKSNNIKLNILGEKLLWFRDNLEPNCAIYTPKQTVELIEKYLSRFEEELEQIRIKHSIGNRKNRQHASREDIINLTIQQEREEFNSCGLEIPDVLNIPQFQLLRQWNGELRFLPKFKLKRYSRKYLEGSCTHASAKDTKQNVEKTMDTN